MLNDNSWWISKVVNDLEGIVKLVRSLMCYLKFIKKTIFKVSRSLWWKPHVSVSFGSGEVWTIIEKPDLTILELWWPSWTFYENESSVKWLGTPICIYILSFVKIVLFLRKFEIWRYTYFTCHSGHFGFSINVKVTQNQFVHLEYWEYQISWKSDTFEKWPIMTTWRSSWKFYENESSVKSLGY